MFWGDTHLHTGYWMGAGRFGNTIGASELAAAWSNPNFDTGQQPFEFTRALEIPTLRWVLYDRARLDAKASADTMGIKLERACTLFVWCAPQEQTQWRVRALP